MLTLPLKQTGHVSSARLTRGNEVGRCHTCQGTRLEAGPGPSPLPTCQACGPVCRHFREVWPSPCRGRLLPHLPALTQSLPGSYCLVTGAILEASGAQRCGMTPVRSVTLLCRLRARCCLLSVWLPPSQFPDHSGNGRNARVTSMVTFEVIVSRRTGGTVSCWGGGGVSEWGEQPFCGSQMCAHKCPSKV